MTSSHPQTTYPTAIPDAQSGSLFFKLPPELRNEIYEIVFSVPPAPAIARLAHALPPPRAITQTCRRARDETRGLYQLFSSPYWTASTWTVDATVAKPASQLAALSDADLALIRRIDIQSSSPYIHALSRNLAAQSFSEFSFPWHLRNEKRGWYVTFVELMHSSFYSQRFRERWIAEQEFESSRWEHRERENEALEAVEDAKRSVEQGSNLEETRRTLDEREVEVKKLRDRRSELMSKDRRDLLYILGHLH